MDRPYSPYFGFETCAILRA